MLSLQLNSAPSKKAEVPKGFDLCFSAASKRSLSILDAADVFELDGNEAVGLVDELSRVDGLAVLLAQGKDLPCGVFESEANKPLAMPGERKNL